MARNCHAIQEMLTEVGGRIEMLDEPVGSHLERCAGCREAAADERALGLLLAAAVPPADPAVERRVMAALGPARVRRRLVAFVPVAASIAMAALGVLLVGGVPGVRIISFLPEWSADGWMVFLTSASDWSLAVASGARAMVAVLDPAVAIAAAVLGAGGFAGMAVTGWRWRKASLWRRER